MRRSPLFRNCFPFIFLLLIPGKEALLDKKFSDLDGVCGRTLADIVRYAPEVDSVSYGRVTTESSDEDVILAETVTPGVLSQIERMSSSSKSFSNSRLIDSE